MTDRLNETLERVEGSPTEPSYNARLKKVDEVAFVDKADADYLCRVVRLAVPLAKYASVPCDDLPDGELSRDLIAMDEELTALLEGDDA